MFYFAARIFAVACCLAMCSEADPFSSSAEAKTYFEKRGLKSDLAHVLRGTAFIIDHKTDVPDGMIKYMRPLSAEEAALTKEQIRTLLSLLEDRRTYMPDFMKLCVPSYEIGVTLVSRTSQTEIRFCLACDMMAAVGDDDEITAYIDRGHNKILDLF